MGSAPVEGVGGGQVIPQLRDNFRARSRELLLGHALQVRPSRGLVQGIHRSLRHLRSAYEARITGNLPLLQPQPTSGMQRQRMLGPYINE